MKLIPITKLCGVKSVGHICGLTAEHIDWLEDAPIKYYFKVHRVDDFTDLKLYYPTNFMTRTEVKGGALQNVIVIASFLIHWIKGKN